MKEFKFYSDGFEFPVSVCETQKEAVYEITSAREALKLLDKEGECGCEKLIIDVIYKDGSTYYNSNNYEEEGKFKRTGIARAMVSTEYGTAVFGDFAITEYGDVSIDESDIEEYGVYAGQYDVKEQEAQEVQETVEQTETEANETTDETETAKPETAETDDSGFEYYSVETAYEVDFRDRQNEVFKTYSEAEKTAGDNIILEVDLIVRNDKKAVSEHDKEVFEDETDEIECRCIWYHHNGVKGMIAQDTKRVIKKPETAVTVEQTEVEETAETETEETIKTTAEQETVEGISKTETTTEADDSGFEYTKSQAQEIIMAGTSIAREKYREKHGIHSPMDLKKFSRKQLDDYLSKELDYINKFLNDTIPKEVFNAMKGEIMYA